MVSWMHNTAKNTKTVFMPFTAIVLYGHRSLCVRGRIGHYKLYEICKDVRGIHE